MNKTQLSRQNMDDIFGSDKVVNMFENEVVAYDTTKPYLRGIKVNKSIEGTYTLTHIGTGAVYGQVYLNDMISVSGGGWFLEAEH